MVKKEVIIPEGEAKPVAPYSPAIRAGEIVYTAGQIGLDPETATLVNGGIVAETRQSLINMSKVLDAAGSSIDHVVKTTVFLADMDEYPQMNEIYAKFFAQDPPARSAIQAAKLPLDARVEIEAVAVLR